MSVDFYVAVPVDQWPTAAEIEQCASREGYPIKIKQFPVFDTGRVVTDGAMVALDGTEAYLEGQLSTATLSGEDVSVINARLAAAGSAFRITDGHALMSVRVRSQVEMRATSYVIAGLVVCFGGYGFEPQGNAHGRADFAKSLLDGADLLKGM